MKEITTLLAALIISSTAIAQKSVKEKDILGEWKMIIDLNEERIMDDIEDDEDIPLIGEFIAESVIDVVGNFMDDLDIYFDFRRGGEVRIEVEIFGHNEVEYTDWRINRHGELEIGETDIFDGSKDDIWFLDGDRLVSHDHHGKYDDAEIYMVRVE